jgi:hypothetical protein
METLKLRDREKEGKSRVGETEVESRYSKIDRK